MRLFTVILAVLMVGQCLRADEKENLRPTAEVWFFVAIDCPIANHYVPEMNRIAAEYQDRGVSFSLIYPNTALTEEQLAAHRTEYELKIDGRIDRDHSHVKRAGVTTTPEVAVFDRNGILIYRGMIDNLFTEFGDRRQVASKRYLRDILKQCETERDIPLTFTEPVGCLIEPIK
ncbi:redoxin domain-containing protein [Verrucomicrobiales bacterium]|nr:redoxin domain-containing protein [Verrucomicrobiales bacterium]